MAGEKKRYKTVDGNTAAASMAYLLSEVAAIYPITPSSPMGELADELSAKGKLNIFGNPVKVVEMQSEGGASGAIHGSLSAGALTTTFTASQGLLLMLPNMFKMAGEMLPAVFHVSSRSLAYQSLSIFGDHSDVMAARGTGFAMLSSSSVQDAQDMSLIAHLASLESRIPFLHFFDGFRTSHEVQKIEVIEEDVVKSMFNKKYLEAFRKDALNPDHPVVKVGAENPDVYFQGRETSNNYYKECPGIVKKYLELLEKKTKRKYELFDYIGDKDAEDIIIAMGSSIGTITETVNCMNKAGQKVGAINVRLYRPFSVDDFIKSLPKKVKRVAVLDRTKESGSVGEPLFLDISTAIKNSGKDIKVIGGRYGLSSKEFTPEMVSAVYDHLKGKCTHDFTVGITDDVSNTSLKIKHNTCIACTESKTVVRCKFWGFGSDGTVSANKNSIKIIGDNTDKHVQAYFEYDSKKSGGITISHLRFSDEPILSEYLLTQSDFIALHKPSYIGRYDILGGITEGGTFLLNTSASPEEAFNTLTRDMQEEIIKKKISFYVIDASKIAEEAGLPGRINTVMQAAFFKISKVLPEEEAIKLIKEAIDKQFSAKGKEIVEMNWKCVDMTVDNLKEATVPESIDKIESSASELILIQDNASDFAKEVIEPIMRLKGNEIPVSRITLTGAVPLSTAKLEKRAVSEYVSSWIPEKCIQCGNCAFVCPHGCIRTKQIEEADLKGAPESFKFLKSMTKNDKNLQYKVQVYTEDCQGCTLCVDACPVKEKALKMVPFSEAKADGEIENAEFFDKLKENITEGMPVNTIKGSQLKEPLFEFSGACAGCGETPYIKLATQLFGESMIIANATGCSSIYGGTFPTTPYCTNDKGKGPVWANSLFEDNAEYGFGMKLAVDSNRMQLKKALEALEKSKISKGLKVSIKATLEMWDEDTAEARDNADSFRELLSKELKDSKGADKDTKNLLDKAKELEFYASKKAVWIIGGDGWAYDIGYGGLDHVLAQGENVNVLVLDTEVYSNTGGQSSKATPIGSSAKFAVSGKKSAKKNLGLMMMTYGNIYVASVAMGANKQQLINAMIEAEKHDGPSIIIAYSPCIAHGFNMNHAMEEQKKAVEAGYWPLYRYNPDLAAEGKNPLSWDTPEVKGSFKEFLLGENRYKMVQRQFPEEAEKLFKLAEEDAKRRAEDIKLYHNECEVKEDSEKKD